VEHAYPRVKFQVMKSLGLPTEEMMDHELENRELEDRGSTSFSDGFLLLSFFFFSMIY